MCTKSSIEAKCIHMYHTQSHMSRRVDWLSWERQIGTKGIISPLVLKKWWVYIWGVLNKGGPIFLIRAGMLVLEVLVASSSP